MIWLGAALGLTMALLMLYMPFQFHADVYRHLYPLLRPLGVAFGVSSLALAAGMTGLGLPRWLAQAARGLLVLSLLAWVATQAVVTGLSVGMVAYGGIIAGLVLGGLVPRGEAAAFRAACALILLLVSGVLLAAHIGTPGSTAGLPVWVGWLWLLSGLAQPLGHLLARRRPWLGWTSMLLAALPLGWYTPMWLSAANWIGVGVSATLVAGAIAQALYLRRPWALRLPGLRRRILALAIALAALPPLALGAVAVYNVETFAREQALSALRVAVDQLGDRADRLLAAQPGLAADPGRLGREITRGFAVPDMQARVLRPAEVPARWAAGPAAGALEEPAPGGQRRLVAYLRRPDLTLAVLLPAPVAYAPAARTAAGILLAVAALLAVAVGLGVPLSLRITRFQARLEPADADDEVLAVATVNAMAATLAAAHEENQSQNEKLTAQAEELTAQTKELAAQTKELAAQAEELTGQTEALRLSQAELEQNLALLDTLLESAPVGFGFLDRNLRFVRVNRALAAMNGVPVAEHVGQTIRDVLPQVADLAEPAFRSVLETGQPLVNWELGGETPAVPGQQRHRVESVYPVRTREGRVLGVGTVVWEVTEQRRLQEELRRAELEVAEERERARNRFLQIAAHELRNPMAGVKAILNLMQRRLSTGRPPGELGAQMAAMEREIDRLSVLLNETLDAFRLQEGRLAIRRDRVHLGAVVRAALEPLQAAGLSQSIEFDHAAAPEVWVQGDFLRLEEVFRNLLNNAVKYSSPDGTIRVELAAGAGLATATVQDGGIGIPPDQLERVFGGFFRASNLAGRDPGGLGLGLYICRQLVRLHGGCIWAESTDGAGTTITVELPLTPPASG